MFEEQQHQYKQPLVLLKKYHEYLSNKPKHQFTELLVHERMIYLIATAIENNQRLPEGVVFLTELTTFINSVNIKVMASEIPFEEKLNLVSKCVDMLFYKPVRNSVRPSEKLLQLRALTFNNLSCLYKQNRQLEDALKALDVSLQIEEALLSKNFEDTYKSIASTYINKCVILSSMSLHEQAIETIKTSFDNIERYRERYGSEISEKEQAEIKHMMMLAYFNVAVEHEHLSQIELAVKFYEMAFKLAKEAGNIGVKNQAMNALRNLKAKK